MRSLKVWTTPDRLNQIGVVLNKETDFRRDQRKKFLYESPTCLSAEPVEFVRTPNSTGGNTGRRRCHSMKTAGGKKKKGNRPISQAHSTIQNIGGSLISLSQTGWASGHDPVGGDGFGLRSDIAHTGPNPLGAPRHATGSTSPWVRGLASSVYDFGEFRNSSSSLVISAAEMDCRRFNASHKKFSVLIADDTRDRIR